MVFFNCFRDVIFYLWCYWLEVCVWIFFNLGWFWCKDVVFFLEIVGNYVKVGNMVVEMGEKYDEDDKVDILIRIIDFIDNYLRGFRVRKERVF